MKAGRASDTLEERGRDIARPLPRGLRYDIHMVARSGSVEGNRG
jgi:hypothetical protein